MINACAFFLSPCAEDLSMPCRQCPSAFSSSCGSMYGHRVAPCAYCVARTFQAAGSFEWEDVCRWLVSPIPTPRGSRDRSRAEIGMCWVWVVEGDDGEDSGDRGPSEPSGALPDATHVQNRPEQAWLGLIPGPCSLSKPQFLLLLQGTHLTLHPSEPFTFLFGVTPPPLGHPSFLHGSSQFPSRWRRREVGTQSSALWRLSVASEW